MVQLAEHQHSAGKGSGSISISDTNDEKWNWCTSQVSSYWGVLEISMASGQGLVGQVQLLGDFGGVDPYQT